MLARAVGLASHPRLPWLLAALATLLVAPSLAAGFLLDDYWHQNALASGAVFGAPGSPYGLFVFVPGDPDRVRAMADSGTLPWWTPDTLRIAFWRPIAELSHALDHWLAPREPALAHLHNLLWGALLVLLATRLFREVHGVGVAAGLAALVFAVDDAHAFPLVWIAGRNALIAGCFGIAAVLSHIRWRRHGWRPGALWGPVFFAGALLGAESGIGAFAYLLAYEVVHGRERASGEGLARVRPLVAYVVIVAVWLIVYRALGYGVSGSGQYLDPFGDPLGYLTEAPERALLLLAGQLATLPLVLEGFHYLDEAQRRVVVGASGLLVAGVGWVLVASRRRRPEAQFWLIGMLASLAPALILGAFSRVLLFAGIGGAGLLGICFGDWWRHRGEPSRPLCRAGRYALVAMHLLFAPLTLLGLSVGLPHVMDHQQTQLDALPGAERDTWIFVNPRAAFWTGGNVQASREFTGQAVPRVRALASGALGVSVRRSAPRCLELAPEGGYLWLTADRLFRHPSVELPRGWRRELPGLSIEVLDVLEDGRPRTARFCFDRDLSDPSLHWVAWVGGQPEAFRAPEVGASVELDP